MRPILLLTLVLVFSNLLSAQPNLIPLPVSYVESETVLSLEGSMFLDIQSENEQVNKHILEFATYLGKRGVEVMQPSNALQPGVRLKVSCCDEEIAGISPDGYALEIDTAGITLAANHPSGIFYGLQTLKQLFPDQFAAEARYDRPIELRGCSIRDYPRFQWRGLMMDVSRHFFSVGDVKAFIDKMAEYKFNVFHWHLTDDEGWRIEIKSLPKLTEIGAWRVERHGRFGEERPYPKKGEKATYGGYYSHEQIRDIVNYAAERHITIVPEIDMPGHSMAALAAYPELSTKKEAKFVNPGSKFAEWYGGGRFEMLIENTLNPADEKVYDFVDKVFTEVAELFPGEYIHMGGDECYKGYWEADPGVQKFMKENGIEDSHGLQAYFVNRVNAIITSKGKKMIGWDEILEGGLTEEAAVMSWRGMKGGIEATHKGHKVVMSPTSYAYLDYTQGDHSVENPIYADLSLEKCYSFEPAPEEVVQENVLGGQGNLWAEVIPNLPYAFYMAYPRALALAETFWSQASVKEWKSFIQRTESHFQRFDAAGQNICKAVYDPVVEVFTENDLLMCRLTNSVPGTTIYYTVDNTYPVHFGQKYDQPFEIPEGNLSLCAAVYRDGELLGRQLQIHRQDLVKRAQ